MSAGVSLPEQVLEELPQRELDETKGQVSQHGGEEAPVQAPAEALSPVCRVQDAEAVARHGGGKHLATLFGDLYGYANYARHLGINTKIITLQLKTILK